MIGFRCWHDAGKRWKLNDGMDVRLDVAVVCVCVVEGWSAVIRGEVEVGVGWP